MIQLDLTDHNFVLDRFYENIEIQVTPGPHLKISHQN